MKAEELRIGNLVFLQKDGDKKEYQIDSGFDLYKLDESDCADISPIPITEDWLVKLGFKTDGYGEFERDQILLDCEYTDAGEWIVMYCKAYIKADIKYLHQLQNLCFALTGIELAVKQLG